MTRYTEAKEVYSSLGVDAENALEIIVSNHLAYTRRDSYSNFHLYEASGLLGPVKIKLYNK